MNCFLFLYFPNSLMLFGCPIYLFILFCEITKYMIYSNTINENAKFAAIKLLIYNVILCESKKEM